MTKWTLPSGELPPASPETFRPTPATKHIDIPPAPGDVTSFTRKEMNVLRQELARLHAKEAEDGVGDEESLHFDGLTEQENASFVKKLKGSNS